MNVSVKETGAWERRLEIEIPADEVDRRIEEVARRIQRRAKLSGFRPGKAPLDLVRQQFAGAVEEEFLESFIPSATREALEQQRLDPVAPPMVGHVRFTPGSPLKFEAAVVVRPEVEVKNARGLKARRRVQEVDDAAVERTLADLREESAVFVDLDRPAVRGDVVLLDSTRLDANGRRLGSSRIKNRRLELGAAGMPPDLENALLGATAGQERTFTLSYPADHQAAELAGKQVRYVVKIRKIQEKKLRELDDNLAREVFHLDSVEDLRARIRQNLEGEAAARSRRELEGAIIDELIQRHPVELPERLVQWTLDSVIAEAAGGRDLQDSLRQELEARYRPGVERSLRRELLLEALARQEHLEVSEQEVAEEIDRMAQLDPREASRVRARFQTAERRRALRDSMREKKALDWLIDAAEIQDEVVSNPPLVVPAAR